MRIEHIGIAVSNIGEAIKTYSSLLGSGVYKTETVASEGVRTHFLWADGVKIELLESLSESSPVARFLSKRGEGFHHIAFSVDDAAAASKRLSDEGFDLIGTGPSNGADGGRIFFVHPRSVHGLLVEGCERSAASSAVNDPDATGPDTSQDLSDARGTLAIKIASNASPESRSSLLAKELAVRLEPVFKVSVTSTSPGGRVNVGHTLTITEENEGVDFETAGAIVIAPAVPGDGVEGRSVWEIRHKSAVFRLPVEAVVPLDPVRDALTPLLLSIWISSA